MKSFLLSCSGLRFAFGAALASPEEVAPANTSKVTLPFGTQPIAFSKLSTIFPPPVIEATIAIEAIRNTLAPYPFAIDGKDFAALSNIFAQNVVANYFAPLNILTPLSAVISVLESSLGCVTTQHSVSTQLITVLSVKSAFSVTYFRAMHFGRGNTTAGPYLEAFGQYQDTWERQADLTWKIV
jgi:hypothetical protein